MSKPRILFLSPLPPPYYGSAISSQTCLNVLNSNENYEVASIRLNYSKSFSDLERISIRKAAGYIYTFFKILFYIIKKRPDLIYIMPATTGYAFIRDFSLILLVKSFQHNILFHLRTQIHESQKKHTIKGFIFRKAFQNGKVIVLGKELKEGIDDYFPPDDIFILPNAIKGKLDDEEFNALEQSRKTKDSLRLLFISNMMKSKGWEKALDAASILLHNNYRFHFSFAGSWPSKKEENDFYVLIEKYALENKVDYLGYIKQEQKQQVLTQSDVLVFPTEYPNEALPRVIIEAFEYGIPVISTRNGSIPSMIVHGKTGFLLDEVTPQQIASFLEKLYDRNTLLEMGRNSRERFLRKYELSTFSKNFLQIIEKCIA